MCELCSSDKKIKQNAKNHMLAYADRLDDLAEYYRDLAYERISPHKPEAEKISYLAKSILREIAKNWI